MLPQVFSATTMRMGVLAIPGAPIAQPDSTSPIAATSVKVRRTRKS
jgi:hypothetical protein